MPSTFPSVRDAALDRVLAGAIDAVASDFEQLPVPLLVSMAAVSVARRSLERNDESLVRGATLTVEQRAVTVGEVAVVADLPANTIADAVRTGCCRSSTE